MKNDKIKRHSLAEIQQAFFSVIINPLTPNLKSDKRLCNGEEISKIAEEFIEPNDRLTSFERLEIYNKQFWFRIIRVLNEDFCGLRQLLGDAKFNPLIIDYIKKYPPKSYTLRDLGYKLDQFIKESPSYLGRRYNVALEMVQFELSQVNAFDGPSLPQLDADYLVSKSPDEIKLKLQPYITLMELNFALDDFLISLRREKKDRSEAATENTEQEIVKACVLPKRKKIYVAIHRYQNDIYYKRLDKSAFVLLRCLQSGKSLSESCEEALQAEPRKLNNLAKGSKLIEDWFANWSSLGWFAVEYN